MQKADARHEQVKKIISTLAEDDKTAVVSQLWEPLKTRITALVSEEGFQFLLDRCIFLAGRQYPWLTSQHSLSSDSPLSDLKKILEQRELREAREASTALLIRFIDLVASLIGELLTIDILRSAWGKAALGSLDEEAQQ